MPSAWDERTQLLSGTTSAQKALMKHREDLAAQETPSFLDKIASPEGAATGLLALLAGITGGGRDAADVLIGGATGAADSVAQQKATKFDAVSDATKAVFDQISRDQTRALQVMNINPEIFYDGAQDNKMANEALGMHEGFTLKTAFEGARERDKRYKDSVLFYNMSIGSAETEQQVMDVWNTTLDMRDIKVDEDILRNIAKREMTIDDLMVLMKDISDESYAAITTKMGQDTADGVSMNDPDNIAGYLNLLRAPTLMSAAGMEQSNGKQTRAYLTEALSIAAYYKTTLGEVLDASSGIWADAAKVKSWLMEQDVDVPMSFLEEIQQVTDLAAYAVSLEASSREAYEAEMAHARKFESITPIMSVEDRVKLGIMAHINTMGNVVEGFKGYTADSAINRISGRIAVNEGITVPMLQEDPSLEEFITLRATVIVDRYGDEWDELRGQAPSMEMVEALDKSAAEAEKLVEWDANDNPVDPSSEEFADWYNKATIAAEAREAEWFSHLTRAMYINYRAGQDDQEAFVPGDLEGAATLGEAAAVAEAKDPSGGMIGPPSPVVPTPIVEGDPATTVEPNVIPALQGAAFAQKERKKAKAGREQATALRKSEHKLSIRDREAIEFRAAELPPPTIESYSAMTYEEMKEDIIQREMARRTNAKLSPGFREKREEKYRADANETFDTQSKRYGDIKQSAAVRGQDIPETMAEQMLGLLDYMGLEPEEAPVASPVSVSIPKLKFPDRDKLMFQHDMGIYNMPDKVASSTGDLSPLKAVGRELKQFYTGQTLKSRSTAGALNLPGSPSIGKWDYKGGLKQKDMREDIIEKLIEKQSPYGYPVAAARKKFKARAEKAMKIAEKKYPRKSGDSEYDAARMLLIAEELGLEVEK